MFSDRHTKLKKKSETCPKSVRGRLSHKKTINQLKILLFIFFQIWCNMTMLHFEGKLIKYLC